MRPQDLIAKKRDGGTFSREEVRLFIEGVCDSSWADYQVSALIMAIYLNGMNEQEQSFLTQEMLKSGETLDFSGLDAPKVDKHSTGGVGDKTSLLIAPILAACGAAVPMISGRGLGHTGGTLDKLESIEGYNVNLSANEFKNIVRECGFGMMGQTADIVPADKKLYSLRDATATVSYIPLIVGSIMSKKLAEGLDALVLDVKTGNGAFMESYPKARELAHALCKTGNTCGMKTTAVISDMSQPLGSYVGNALEVYECIMILRGEAEEKMLPTWQLSIELAIHALIRAGLASDRLDAEKKAEKALNSGEALEKFRQNVKLQGGNEKICDSPNILLPEQILEIRIRAETEGFVSAIDTKDIGNAISEIGGGRSKVDDVVDFGVGYKAEAGLGDIVSVGEVLGILYCRNSGQAGKISKRLAGAYEISLARREKPELICEVIC